MSDTATYLEAQAHQVRSSTLKKTLGWQELISLGVGCTIGAGIFVVTGVVAATKAGPALFLCYIVAGLACCLAGLCYSELAAMTPSAGSAYAYARASLGQTIGWMIGWDLTLGPRNHTSCFHTLPPSRSISSGGHVASSFTPLGKLNAMTRTMQSQ
jgi:amino acid permease